FALPGNGKRRFQHRGDNELQGNALPGFVHFRQPVSLLPVRPGRDRSVLVTFDPKAGKEMEVIYEHPDVDVEGVDYSRKRKMLTAVYYETDKPKMHFLDSETENIYNKINSELPDYTNRITRKNKEENKLLVHSNSDRYYGGYYFYDVDKGQLQKLADFMPGLKEDNMAIMKPITYTSRDGLTIHGYLTLPKGLEAKNLPVVINP